MRCPAPFNSSTEPIADRFFRRAKFAAVCVLALGLPSLAAQAEPLDESTAIKLGLSRPVVADLLGGRLDMARGALRSAGQWANPEFQYEREGIDGLGGNGTENFFRLSQEIDLSGERGFREEAAEKRLGAAGHDAQAYRRDLTAEIRRHFFNLLRGKRLEQVARDWMAQLEKLDGIIAMREAAGEASRYDRRRIAQERAGAPALLAEIRAERNAARERLTALLGAETMAKFDGLEGRIMPAAPASLPQLLMTLEKRPDLRSMQARAEAYGLDRQAARRSAIPDVTVGVGVRTIEGNLASSTGVLLSASVPLPVFNRGQGETLQAQGQARATRAEYRLALDRARAAVSAARQRLVSLRKAAIQYRENSVKPATDLKATAEAAYRAGEVGILALLDAHETAFEAERRALQLEMQARHARIELDRLSGGPNP